MSSFLWYLVCYLLYRRHSKCALFLTRPLSLPRSSLSPQLPLHLVCTYDILALEAYNTTTFNSGLHILSMRAGAALARVMGDNATATAADAAAARATIAVQALLWNSTYGYYRAYTSGDAIMSDALYGVMLVGSV